MTSYLPLSDKEIAAKEHIELKKKEAKVWFGFYKIQIQKLVFSGKSNFDINTWKGKNILYIHFFAPLRLFF